MSTLEDAQVVSVRLVRHWLKRIEDKTNTRQFRGMATRNPAKMMNGLIDRLDEIDTLCEEFTRMLKTEASVPQGSSQELMIAQHMEDARNCRRD